MRHLYRPRGCRGESQAPVGAAGPAEVANSYWVTTHPPCCDWDDSHCVPNLSYKDVGGKCLVAEGVIRTQINFLRSGWPLHRGAQKYSLGQVRLNTTALVSEYPLLASGVTATVARSPFPAFALHKIDHCMSMLLT